MVAGVGNEDIVVQVQGADPAADEGLHALVGAKRPSAQQVFVRFVWVRAPGQRGCGRSSVGWPGPRGRGGCGVGRPWPRGRRGRIGQRDAQRVGLRRVAGALHPIYVGVVVACLRRHERDVLVRRAGVAGALYQDLRGCVEAQVIVCRQVGKPDIHCLAGLSVELEIVQVRRNGPAADVRLDLALAEQPGLSDCVIGLV